MMPLPDRDAEHAIQVQALAKHYGSTHALDGVDLEVSRGGVVGLLGPNGAGKTTLVRVLTTLLRPTSGEARIFSLDVVDDAAAIRRMISLTGQYAAVDGLLERFDLGDAADRRAGVYSGGVRRRLDLASSVIVPPRLLFVDEPTTGLDPRTRNQMWDVFRELVAADTTLSLTTQYLGEADQLADRIVVIDHGRIIADGTGDELKDATGGITVEVLLGSGTDVDAACALLAGAGLAATPVRGALPDGFPSYLAFVMPGIFMQSTIF